MEVLVGVLGPLDGVSVLPQGGLILVGLLLVETKLGQLED